MTAPRRSFRHPAAVALLLVTAGAACTPSNSTTPAPRGSADSAREGTREPLPTPVVTQDTASAPEESALAEPPPAPPPPVQPRVAVRPVMVPQVTGPYSVRIVDANHRNLPVFGDHGRTYVMGEVGERYSIAVHNPTGRRVEAVVSVDGLDAMDGQAANYASKRGYILPAYGDFTIDGFRTSYDSVATFRFSSVANSYAGRLGQPRDVGVVGVAFFPEQPPPPPPPVTYYYPPSPRRAPAKTPASVAPSEYPDDISPAPQAHASGGRGGAPTTPPAATSGRGRMAEVEGARKAVDRPGLGTEFGEARDSHVDMVSFVRANSSIPSQLVAIRYNDRDGLVALGIEIPTPYASTDRDLHLRETADPFRENRFAQPPP